MEKVSKGSEEKMKTLFLEDLEGKTVEELQDHLISEYKVERDLLNQYNIFLAYESVGSWGCDSSSFFILQSKKSGGLFEVRGSHCSCDGFEGQFEPEPISIEYLTSENFYFCCGGYDTDEDANRAAVKNFITQLAKEVTEKAAHKEFVEVH